VHTPGNRENRVKAFDMLLRNKSLDAISKSTGLKADEIQKIKDDSIAKLRKDHFLKFQTGAKADGWSLITGKRISDSSAEAEFQKWLRILGLVPDSEQGK